MRSVKTNKIAISGLLAAMAYISLFLVRIPIIPPASFLRLDIKDVFITVGALIFGPLYGLIIAFIVSFLQMLTASEYGLIGLAMNTLSSTSFVCVASFIYRKVPSFKGLVFSMFIGCISMTITMLLWNYIFTPMYMGVSREIVKGMLISVFLPFNIIKSSVNAVITVLLFRVLKEKSRIGKDI